MAYDPIAQARIEIELNDDAVVAGLQRVDREYTKTMRDIDRQRAEAKIDLDTSGYDDAIKNIRREMKELEGRKATADADLDDKTFKRKMTALRKELKDVTGQKATIELELKGEEETKKAQERIRKSNEKMVSAIEKREAQRQREYEKAEARRIAGLTREGNLRMTAAKREDGYAKARENALVREGNLRLAMMRRADIQQRNDEAAAVRRQRELDSIPRLQREYADLTTKMEQLGAARRKAFGDTRTSAVIDLKVGETEAKMRALVKELERIGSSVDVRVNFKSGHALGADVRKGLQQGGMLEASYQLGRGMGLGILRGIRNTFSPRNLQNKGLNALNKIGSILDSISSAAVRLGPFTATIRSLLVVMSVLGPTIVDLAGALGSLVGVVGTGLAGAATLGAGAVAALGVSLGGVGFLLPSLMRDFKNLNTLQDAYHKQVLKTGANSDKAKTKLKEYNHALGEVEPTTRKAFLSLDKLQTQWRNMSKAARPDFYNALGQAITTVNKRFDWFRKNTLAAFHQVTLGWKSWMKGLRGDEAGRILETLGKNGNAALRPLMAALGNLVTWFGRVAAASSNYLPGLARQFRDWTKGVADSVGPTTGLGDKIARLVDHTRSLGRFLLSTGRFLVSFFNIGADAGKGFLDVMTKTIDGWTEFNHSADGRNKIRNFFDQSVKGARALYNLLAPLVATFVTWAQKMSPIVTGFLDGAGAVASFTTSVVKLLGLQNSVSALATTLGAFWAIGKIQAATLALTGFSKALLGISAAQGVASGSAGAAGAGGLMSRILGTGAGNRIVGPAEKMFGSRLGAAALGGLKFAGLAGVGILAMQLIGKGMGTLKAREGAKSSILGLSRDVLSTFSFGIADSAEESSRKAAAAIGGALRRNMNLELNKNIRLGGKGLNGVTTLDLNVDQKKMARNFQLALQAADRIAKNHHLPPLTQAVKVTSNPADFRTIEQNFNRLDQNLATTIGNIRRNSDSTLAAIGRSMDTNTLAGQRAVERNMGATVLAITHHMGTSKKDVTSAMREIRHQFEVNSEASKHSADINFGAARSAIKMAVKDGQMSSQKGLSEIRKLWVSYLKLYGFSEKEATNMSKGNSYIGGPEEGTRGPGRSGTVQRKAAGGLVNIGRPGQVGRDSVPMNLGGVPAIVAPGEQIAVFNRHQQRAIGGMVPGGLEGFFAANKRPHHMASGGIVPVPGFPGEMAASSILDEIAMIHNNWGLTLTDAYGQGHKSPGHTVTGTAADFAGPDRAMDAAVKALVGMGYLVGYDGRFGSQNWPGHGPSTVAGANAHLHVELGGEGVGGGPGAVATQTIKRQMVQQGLGAVTTLTQAAVDVVRNVAQQSLDRVAQQSLAVATAGGGGGGANEGQVRAWLAAGLRLAGLSAGGGNVDILFGRTMQESGGNPRAINNWDSNAKAGHPSKGLLQTIDSTFERYKVAGHDDIWNPVDNAAAAVRYMMATYGHLVGRSGSGYAQGGIVTMDSKTWAKGGVVERPTLMTGEDGRKAPEYVVGTNPAFRRTNIQALTNAAAALGVPMARKSKTGTMKPSLLTNYGGEDAARLSPVKHYAVVQQQEEDKRREISIAEGRVHEPESFIKQQGTDAAGNPVYTVDQAVVDAYAKQLGQVRTLYNDLIGIKPGTGIMAKLQQAAEAAYNSIDLYRIARTTNMKHLDAQNAINKRLMGSKDKDTAAAAKRRYDAGVEMRASELAKRQGADQVKAGIQDDQHDAVYRTEEYATSRSSVVEDIMSLGQKAADAAASETKSAYQEPDTGKPDMPPTPGQMATDKLDTEYALAKAGYGMNGQLGSQRDIKAIISDMIAANELRITEAQTMLNDADPTNDQDAYSALTQAANAISGLKDELSQSVPNMALETSNLGGAMLDLYKSFGGNFSLAQSGLSAGNQVASSMALPATGSTVGQGAPVGGGGVNVVINQEFPQQPDPVTWAAATNYELNAAL